MHSLAAIPSSRAWLRPAIGLLIAASGLIGSALMPIGFPLATLIALQIAGGVGVCWLCGGSVAVACCTVWMIGNTQFAPSGERIAWVSLGVPWGVMLGLIWGTASVRSRLRDEHQRARLDALTGIPNRQAFLERCTAELSRARRHRRPLTLALLDGDDFKTINDRQGHGTGDQALAATARVLAETVRTYDFVGRLGGDEFVVLYPETGTADAEHAVARLQRALQSEIAARFPPLTYSIGAVTFAPGDEDATTCLSRVDRVLYHAKRTGKGTTRFESAENSAAPQQEDSGQLPDEQAIRRDR